MKKSLKILGISLLGTIIFIIESAILPYSESFKEASQEGNPLSIVFLLIVNIWFTISVFYIGKNSLWKKKRVIWSLIFVYLTVYSFMTQIETLFFRDAFEILTPSDVWLIMVTNILPLLVIIPLTLGIVPENSYRTGLKIKVTLSKLLFKIVLLAVVYLFIYFLFGYFVAWQFADLREFYSGSTEKQAFIPHMISNFRNTSIVSFQFLRGALFSIFILPIIFMLHNKSKELLVSLLLIYLSTAIILVIPNFLFPDSVRWAHFIEMTSSMTLFSVITWLVWRKNIRT